MDDSHAPPTALARRAFLCFALLGSCLPACNRPRSPELTPHVVRLAGVSASGLDLDVQLSVHNPNSFPIAAEAVEGTLVSGGREIGRGTSNPRDPIPAGGTSLVDSRVHVSWAGLTSVAPLLASERIPYEFRGQVSLGGERLKFNLPFTLTGELTRTELLNAGLRGF